MSTTCWLSWNPLTFMHNRAYTVTACDYCEGSGDLYDGENTDYEWVVSCPECDGTGTINQIVNNRKATQ
jgi:DnaJ-class molecular chaperone